MVKQAGHFKAEEWDAGASQYVTNSHLGIKITVDVRKLTR